MLCRTAVPDFKPASGSLFGQKIAIASMSAAAPPLPEKSQLFSASISLLLADGPELTQVSYQTAASEADLADAGRSLDIELEAAAAAGGSRFKNVTAARMNGPAARRAPAPILRLTAPGDVVETVAPGLSASGATDLFLASASSGRYFLLRASDPSCQADGPAMPAEVLWEAQMPASGSMLQHGYSGAGNWSGVSADSRSLSGYQSGSGGLRLALGRHTQRQALVVEHRPGDVASPPAVLLDAPCSSHPTHVGFHSLPSVSATHDMVVILDGPAVNIFDLRQAERNGCAGRVHLPGVRSLYGCDSTAHGGGALAVAGDDRTVYTIDPRKWSYAAAWPNSLKYEAGRVHFSPTAPMHVYSAGLGDSELTFSSIAGPQRGSRPSTRVDGRWLGLAQTTAHGDDVVVGLTAQGTLYTLQGATWAFGYQPPTAATAATSTSSTAATMTNE
ncbi:hypothetical protein H696_04743 [Fonticula alba]|uniref:Uncharacterized protein n=1 Tax=Fonticula alba TaxID=691883 RepID=A0A058Z2G0_FONAL|nr:hypothetical protein H696_04743 [Fonticula alba]KCV68449.1 hypothetical protein H696_04743 [Fonticula alba]|eukprot:XP_009496881.1 hypothetical protein H696_04743 [Fonticula alba]